ncbi:hypothetical protein ABFS82_02G007400 [Erythranthe guttata]|uniref:SKP1-like protein n=1 Tax=Erythranthe guttata TaxID=4155 RepID=A0A022RCK9_ERYGU|nr:PREDICTED: SKP1-like protein 1A [Erythranthe guttata]EYU37961.1 hypothetical protein MIMGU_mgv1a019768mg [Erythranthe guttata]|eukprot:XP_012836826.1 PREDICTED: SKP1-like protein 1A [Erythranthe guttata]
MSSSSGAAQKKIVVKSSDGDIFEMDEAVASNSLTIKNMIEDGCADDVIPLPNVNTPILAMIIQYCKHHTEAAADKGAAAAAKKVSEDSLIDFDTEFMDVEQCTRFDLLLAANYLNIKSLMDLICETVAGTMKGKSPVELREMFNIENDFTPEEEEKFRKDRDWKFENN